MTTIRWAATFASAALIFAACGDGTSSTATSSTGGSTTSRNATTQSTTATTPSNSRPSTPPTTAPVEQTVVTTYFSREGLLVAGSRAVPKADALRSAVAAVAAG